MDNLNILDANPNSIDEIPTSSPVVSCLVVRQRTSMMYAEGVPMYVFDTWNHAVGRAVSQVG
jgi:hypothetical protein